MNLLVSNEAAKGHAAPAHASTHQAAGQRLSSVSINVVAILVVHGNGLGPGAHEGVLPAAAHAAGVEGAGGHVDVGIAVGEVEFGKGRGLGGGDV